MNRRPSGRAVIWVTAGNFAQPVSAFAVAPVLAQSLGVDGRGEVAGGTAPLLLMAALGSIGLVDSVTYHIAARIGSGRVVFARAATYVVASGLLLTGLVFFAAPLLSGANEDVEHLIRLATIALVPLLVVGIARGLAQGLQRWGLVNAEKFLSASIRLGAIGATATIGALDPQLAVIILAWAPVVGGVVYAVLIRRRLTPVLNAPRPRLLGFGLRVWVGSLSGILLMRIDQLLLTPLAGVYELGLYVTAVNVADVIIVLQASVGAVLFSADASDPRDERVYLGSRISVLAGGLAAVIIGASAQLWVPVLFGADFAASTVPLYILLVAAVLGAPGSVAGTALGARGRPGLRSLSLLLAAIVNVVVLVTIAPAYGAVGAALATLAGTAVASALNVVLASQLFGLRPIMLCVPQLRDIRVVLRSLHRGDGER